MPDRYSQLVNTPPGRVVARSIGLPRPVELERHAPGRPVIAGPALLGAAPGGRLAGAAASVLAAVGAEVHTGEGEELRRAAADAGLDARLWSPGASGERRFAALIFDASGISTSDELRELLAFFHPSIRSLGRCGRVVVLGPPPDRCGEPREATAQRAVEGFVRSLAKEAREGATAQLVRVAPSGEGGLETTLRFLLSARSAYVSGQAIEIGAADPEPAPDPERPLAGRAALVTGAARGIGEAIARTLARDGADVVGIDVPSAAADLEGLMAELDGEAITLDITEPDAPERIAERLAADGSSGVLVHNAGITRDRTIARMEEAEWSSVLDVNLASAERINAALLERDLLGPGARVVCVSSISGIAGNAGQTNYSTSKAGVIGMVRALAPALAERGATINAIAPGFIETRMTAAMPITIREAGRRMNSLSQAGLPIDVAEAIAWLASPGSGGVNGNVVRVCGQSMLGA